MHKEQRQVGFILTMVLAGGLLAVAASFTVPTYGPPQTLINGGGAYAYGNAVDAASSDFNCDGVADAVVLRAQFQQPDLFPIELYLGNGSGGITNASVTMIPANAHQVQWPREMILDDFNGDGRPDVFVADTGIDRNPWPGYQNTLLLSSPDCRLIDGTGGLPQQMDYSHAVSSADVDGDGDIDLAVQNQTWRPEFKPPQILLNDGTGRFSIESGALPPAFVVYDYTNSYTTNHLVDVNNDGKPDLVFGADQATPASKVLLNDGTGHFSVLANALPPKPTPFEGDCLDIENYDLNRDGYEDLLLLFTKKAPAYYQGRWIQVLINNGDGTFHDETSTRYPQVDNTSTYFIFLHMVDIDGNGYLDVIGQVPFLNSNGNHKYLLADANGTLTDLPVVPIYAQCGCAGVNAVITFVDRNRDGHRDVWSFGSLGGFMDGLGVMHRVAINVSLRPNTGAVLPPGIPQSVVATQSIANRVQIAWKYVWGATSYQVWKSSSPSDTGSMIGTTTAVRFDDPAASSNAAYYYVRAVNSAAVSGASKTAVGKLAGAPQIQGQPQSQTIAPGQTATLTVTAVGSPALDYQWYSGDSGDTTNPIAGANADTLTTPALNQISKYWVRVSNAIGTATSRTASIAMAASPASLPVLTNVAPASAFTGNTAQLSLSGTNFVPGETSLFLSGGGSILGAVTITGTTTATATLILKPDATAGVRSITVKTPQGTSGPLNFTIGRKMSRQVVSQ